MDLGFLPRFISFLFVNFCILSGVSSLVSHLFSKNSSLDRFIIKSIFFFAYIVVFLGFLGLISKLNYTNFFLLSVLFFVFTKSFFYQKSTFFQKYLKPLLNGEFSKESFLKEFNFKSFQPLNFLPHFIFLVVLIVLFFLASINQVIETDSLIYHLPHVATWLQNQSIWQGFNTVYAGPIGYYPSNYELLSLFTVLPFKEDFLVNLVNFSIYIPSYLVIFSLLKKLKLSSKIAALAAIIPLFSPILIRQASIPQNDLFLFFTFLTSLFSLSLLHQRFSISNQILFSISLGLFLGTKANALVYGFLLYLIYAFISYKNKQTWLNFFAKQALSVLLFIAFGAFWYLRNWIIAANPFFPIDFNFLNIFSFSGYPNYTQPLHGTSMFSNLGEANLLSDFFTNLTISSGFIGILSLLTVFLPLLKVKKINKTTIFFQIFSLLLFFVYLISPFSYRDMFPNIRYLLPFLGFTQIFLFYSISRLFPKIYAKKIIIFLSFISGFYTIFLIANQYELIPLINDRVPIYLKPIKENFYHFFKLLLLIFSLISIPFLKQKSTKIGFIIFSLLLSFHYFDQSRLIRDARARESYIFQDFRGVEDESQNYVMNESYVKAYHFVNEKLPLDAKIAYTHFASSYPLFGKNLQRDVSYVNINFCQNCSYHDFAKLGIEILENEVELDWLNNLAFQQKEYLIINDRDPDAGVPEILWVRNNPQIFEEIYRDMGVYIYKINQDILRAKL